MASPFCMSQSAYTEPNRRMCYKQKMVYLNRDLKLQHSYKQIKHYATKTTRMNLIYYNAQVGTI